MAELISRCYARSCKIDRSCIELCAIRATRTHDDYNRSRQIGHDIECTRIVVSYIEIEIVGEGLA